MLYHDATGFIHLLASVLSLLSGSFILLAEKGTKLHRSIGYFYSFAMMVVIATSFMMYRLFGSFGIFHVAALISFFTLLGGILPIFLKKPEKQFMELHFSFMYWSVFGLYAAFVSEIFTRLLPRSFFSMLGIATFLVMGLGYLFFYKNKKKWKKSFVAIA